MISRYINSLYSMTESAIIRGITLCQRLLMDGGMSPTNIHELFAMYSRPLKDAIDDIIDGRDVEKGGFIKTLNDCVHDALINSSEKSNTCIEQGKALSLILKEIKSRSGLYGEGGYGTVHILNNECFGDNTIVKYATSDEKGIEYDEIKFNTLFSLINIAPLIFYYKEFINGNHTVLVQEKIVPLTAHIENNLKANGSMEMSTSLAMKYAANVSSLHSLGIHHGDVHMMNIGLFDRPGAPESTCLIDFGYTGYIISDDGPYIQVIGDYAFVMNSVLIRESTPLNDWCALQLLGKKDSKRYMGLSLYQQPIETVMNERRSPNEYRPFYTKYILKLSAAYSVIYSKRSNKQKTDDLLTIMPREKGLGEALMIICLGVILASGGRDFAMSNRCRVHLYPRIKDSPFRGMIRTPLAIVSSMYGISPNVFMAGSVGTGWFDKLSARLNGDDFTIPDANGIVLRTHLILLGLI